MRALLLVILAGLVVGCVSTARTREADCLGALLMDVSESKQDMEAAREQWRTAQQARAEQAPRPWYGSSEATSEGGMVFVSVAPGSANLNPSRYAGEPDPVYDRLMRARVRFNDAQTWYTRVANRIQTRFEEDDILYSALGALVTSPVSFVFYPLIRWNVRSVLWDGADPNADDDPIQRFCRMRLS